MGKKNKVRNDAQPDRQCTPATSARGFSGEVVEEIFVNVDHASRLCPK